MGEDENSAGGLPKRALSELGVTVHELLRYGYGGVVSFVVAGTVNPEGTGKLLKDLNPALTVLIAFAVGAAIYIGYRPLVGEPLYFVRELLHTLFNCRKSRGHTCKTALLRKRYGVSFWLASDAFRTIRDSKHFNRTKQQRFYRQHSENHVLYVTSVILFVGAIVLYAGMGSAPLVHPHFLLGLAIFFLFSAVAADVLLCREECKCVLEICETQVRKLLQQTEFI